MSLPISPDHSSSSSQLAGRPHSSLAAHSVVAALPEPPPRPAPCGTRLRRSTLKRCVRPVLARNRLRAWAGGRGKRVVCVLCCVWGWVGGWWRRVGSTEHLGPPDGHALLPPLPLAP